MAARTAPVTFPVDPAPAPTRAPFFCSDFGFAKRVSFKTYTLCGTPEYIAPEVLLNKVGGPQSCLPLASCQPPQRWHRPCCFCFLGCSVPHFRDFVVVACVDAPQGHGKGVDWWTLGILIFEMLCGQPPFVDDDPMGIYQQILAGKLSFPRCV
jgi:protein kinase A